MSIKNNFPAITPTLNLDFANTKVLDPRITFNRSSTATYYDGKTVAKAEENLLRYSQGFSNGAWTKTETTVTANSTVAPDGTVTAATIIPNTATALHSAYQSATLAVGVTYTVSVFAKAAGYTFLTIANAATGNFRATFDLSTNALLSSSGSVISTGVDVYGDWRRVRVVFSAAASAAIAITAHPTDAVLSTYGATFAGDGVSGAYLWGAQLEQRNQVTAYTPTTSQLITRYQPVLLTAPANTARFDHDPLTGESLGLLIEEQRTNLLPWSEDFSIRSISGGAIQSNVIIAPDGTLTGGLYVPDTSTQDHTVGVTLVSDGVEKVYSIYLKKQKSRFAAIGRGFSVYCSVFDLENGTITYENVPGSSSIQNVGNGWYRCSYRHTIVSGGGYTICVNPQDVGTVYKYNYQGDGQSGVYLWGAQMEAGAFPTSYVKTEASQVTRAADSASMAGANFSSWYRQDAGTLFANISDAKMSATVDVSIASITDNPASKEWLTLSHNALGAYTLVSSGGTIQASIAGGASVASGGSLAAAYAVNDFAFSVAGGSVVTDTSGTVQNAAMLKIGAFGGNPGYLNGHIKRIAYYPKRLSNTQLQALTV